MPEPIDLSIVTMTFHDQVTGPVRFDWLEAAARLAGRSKALHTALSLAWLAALHGTPNVPLTRRTMARWGLSRDSTGDTLQYYRSTAWSWSGPHPDALVALC